MEVWSKEINSARGLKDEYRKFKNVLVLYIKGI